MRILSKQDLESLLTMEDVLGALEEGFRNFKEDPGVIPVRLHLDVKESAGVFLYMPAYLPGINRSGVKIVSVFPGNPALGKPTIYASYLLSDAQTGELVALIEGSTLTGMRTGGASALATGYLAREDARVLGIIGTGFQAYFQVKAILAVRNIERVLAFDRDEKKLSAFCDTLKDEAPISKTATASALVTASDIIVTATTSPVPVFSGLEVRPGTHINAIGSYRPETREIDDDLIVRAKIVVDNMEGALSEAGDLIIPLNEGKITASSIHGDLGDLVTGRKPGRENPQEITLFKSVGFALEDIVVANRAYEKAQRSDSGRQERL